MQFRRHQVCHLACVGFPQPLVRAGWLTHIAKLLSTPDVVESSTWRTDALSAVAHGSSTTLACAQVGLRHSSRRCRKTVHLFRDFPSLCVVGKQAVVSTNILAVMATEVTNTGALDRLSTAAVVAKCVASVVGWSNDDPTLLTAVVDAGLLSLLVDHHDTVSEKCIRPLVLLCRSDVTTPEVSANAASTRRGESPRSVRYTVSAAWDTPVTDGRPLFEGRPRPGRRQAVQDCRLH